MRTRVSAAAIVLALLVGVKSSAAVLPSMGMFPIYHGIVAPLTAQRGFEAVVKLEIQNDAIHFSRCTGAFISDRHVLTAAHCFEVGRKAYLSMPHSRGFWEPGFSEDVHLSHESLDLAIVQYPPNTFRGRPLDFSIFDDSMARQFESGDAGLITLGFGQTESGDDSDILLYRPIGAMSLNADGEFETRDRRRVDHGDSGGPVVRIDASGKASIVAVNHAYLEDHFDIQLFKPLARQFFESVLAAGINIPSATCACIERIAYTVHAVPQGRSRRRVRSWSETLNENHRELFDGFNGCGGFESSAASDRYPGDDLNDGTPTEILRRSSGRSCRRGGARPRTAVFRNFIPAATP